MGYLCCLYDDRALYEKLVLDGFQAGLAWIMILRKRENFRRAFAGFEIETVADYTEREVTRLLADPGIIRNRLKILAVIENARRILAIQQSHGSLKVWLDVHHPRAKAEWVALFKKTFKFTGGEIVGECLMSLGYLPGTHDESCPVYHEILALDPPWRRAAVTPGEGG